MALQTLSIGDTGAEMVSKFNVNFSAYGDHIIYDLDAYKEPEDTDYTLAFQRAIDAMPTYVIWAGSGGTIMLTGKVYTISGTIYCPKSIRIVGIGGDQGTVINLAAQSNCNMFEFGIRNSAEPISINLESLKFSMDTNQTGECSNIICWNYLRHSNFKDLFFVESTGYNFRMLIDAGTGTPSRNTYFYGCAFEKANINNVDIVHDYNLNFNACYFGFGNVGYATHGLYVQQTAQRFVLSNCWFLQDNRAGSFFINGINYAHIVNNHFSVEDGVCGGGTAQITIGTCTGHIEISGNTFGDTTHAHFIRTLNDTPINIKVHDNIFGTCATAPFLFADKTKVSCHDNTMGTKYQEFEDVATILDGQTYLDINHQIFTTPDIVFVTPRADEHVWVTDVGATTFRVNRAASGGNLILNWKTKVKTY